MIFLITKFIYSGIYTGNTRLDIFRSLYTNGMSVDSSIINDSYDGELSPIQVV